MATSLDLSRTYTSYAGVDIRVVINGAQVGSMQALSYAIQREKAPIYVMGSVDPISYSRGKRGIAGTMISLMLDNHLLQSKSFSGEKYLGDTDEVFASIGGTTAGNTKQQTRTTDILNNVDNEVTKAVSLQTVGGNQFSSRNISVSGAEGQAGANAAGPFQRQGQDVAYNTTEVANNYKVAPVFYVDQILPFDIAIVAVNEYGQSAQMRLYGCEILNEGSGFSIDDIVVENQMTYVCRTILPWRSFTLKGKGGANLRDDLYKNVGSPKNRGYATGGSAQVTYNQNTGTEAPPTDARVSV